MKLYEIDNAIMECVDSETGEIVDFDKLNELTMAREDKLEGVGIAIKNLRAEAKAIRDEEKSLAERRKVLENRADGYMRWLTDVLNGEKFETARVKCGFRKSSRVRIDDSKFFSWAISQDRNDLLNFSEPKANKTKIKEVILSGESIPGVALEETVNLNVR